MLLNDFVTEFDDALSEYEKMSLPTLFRRNIQDSPSPSPLSAADTDEDADDVEPNGRENDLASSTDFPHLPFTACG